MLKPTPLRRGDLVGIVSPGAAVDDINLNAGVRVLEAAGFRVRVGNAARRKHGYLAGTDDERRADLHTMFADREVRAIVAARGGYGAGRLLPGFDLATAAADPKIFVGHSDITFLLTALQEQARLVVFHGPMAAGLAHHPEATVHLTAALRGERPVWQHAAQSVVQGGIAEGVLSGGCLSILVSMLGTPWAPQTRDRILFLEEVNEKPYRIDRMLTQLRQAGAFDHVAGVVFGEMDGCHAGPNERVTVRDVIAEAFAAAPYPVAFGLPSGHGRGTLTLPFGVRARLAGERLTLLEAPLRQA